MRVLTVVGARPQFVKAAAVSHALRRVADERLLHTGQHTDAALADAFAAEAGMPAPDLRLTVPATPFGARLAAMHRGIVADLGTTRADAVLVYGDTDSTLAGALAARSARVPLVHVEAGMRSDERALPEEQNRVVADHLAALLLCSSDAAAARLRAEHVAGDVRVVGDVMLDACLRLRERPADAALLARQGVERGAYAVATVHRAENTDDAPRLAALVAALDALDLPVVLPCHPRLRAALVRGGVPAPSGRLRLTEPLPHAAMLELVRAARIVLTDSGGLQKEAWYLGVPCATLRARTEWPETLEGGWNVLVDADPARLRAAVAAARSERAARDLGRHGGGHAAERVAEAIAALRP